MPPRPIKKTDEPFIGPWHLTVEPSAEREEGWIAYDVTPWRYTVPTTPAGSTAVIRLWINRTTGEVQFDNLTEDT